MDALSGTTILSNLIGAVLGVLGLWAFVVRPYQEKLSTATNSLDEATKELAKFRALNFDKELEGYQRRLKILEDRDRDLQIRLPQSYVTISALQRSEEHRDRKFDLVNTKLDDGLANDAATKEALSAIKTQINTLFKLWNEEHRR